MFDYLKQFKSLPKELREKISSEPAMRILSELEEKYEVNLASTVMKVMVKKVNINNLNSFLVSEFSLEPKNAQKLSQELKEKLFFSVSGYLGLKPSFQKEEEHAKKIIKDSGINFSNKEIYERSVKVIITFLRGVRSRIDTRLVLEKPESSGGLGLSQEKTDHLIKTCLNFIANHKEEEKELKKESPVKETLLTDSDALTKIITKEKEQREGEFDLKKELESGRTPSIAPPEKIKKIAGQKEEIKKIEAKKENEDKKEDKKEGIINIAPPPKKEKSKPEFEDQKEKIKDDSISFAPPPKKGLMKQIFKTPKKEEEKKEEENLDIKKEKKEDKKEPIKQEKAWSSKPRPVSDSGSKKKIEDIKKAPKVMGPIDELRYLSLVNFRRLSEDPEEAVMKIKKKISVLEADGFDKKIEGVIAWKKSPVNRFYILLGQEAVKHGVSLKKITDKKREKNDQSLSWDEVKAIMKLNSQLSYY